MNHSMSFRAKRGICFYLITLMFLAASISRAWGAVGDFPTNPPPTETEQPAYAEVGFSSDTLSNNFASWTEEYLSVHKEYGKGENVYGMFRNANRFGQTDQEISVGGSHRLDSSWVGNLEGSFSFNHNFLPQYGIGGELYHTLSAHWGLYFGALHRQYNTSNVNIENVGLETYSGTFRFSYTFRLAQVSNTSTNGASHTVEFDDYYTDRDKIGLVLSVGTDPENIGGNVVVVSNVRSANLGGIHWFNPDWGFTYGIGVTDQNPFYTRTTYQIGLTHSF